MDATVLVNPPNKNKDENKNPKPCFTKVFTLNNPKSPINVMSGKIHIQGFFIKLWKGFGSITCHTNRDMITSARSTKLRLKTTFFNFGFKSELVLKIIQLAPWMANATTPIIPNNKVNQSITPSSSACGLKVGFQRGKKK